jgi:hypothetical protein
MCLELYWILLPCKVIFLLVIFAEKKMSLAKCHTESRTHTTGFFSSFMFWTNSSPSQCRRFLFSLGGTWKVLCFFESPVWTAAGLFTRGRLLGYVVDALNVEDTDPTSALSSSSSLSSCTVSFWTQSSMKSLKTKPVRFWFWLVVYFLKIWNSLWQTTVT